MAYSEEDKTNIVNTVCERIMEGEAIREIMKDKSLPNFNTLLIWISNDEKKSNQYAKAMEIRSELLFEEMLEIADDGSNDHMTITRGNEQYNVENKEFTSRSRLRVDTRKWYLSKLNPKKFGDKVEHSGDVNNNVRYILKDE